MTTLNDIEQLAERYAKARRTLSSTVTELQQRIEAIKAEYIDAIRHEVGVAAEAHDELRAAIEAAPQLFDKPRTRVLSGVKVGITKQRGQVEMDDESKVIERIRTLLPAEQAELLIRVRESVQKSAVYDLTAADLKRLGIRITDDCDQVLIKPADSEVDKLVNSLLKDAERIEEAA